MPIAGGDSLALPALRVPVENIEVWWIAGGELLPAPKEEETWWFIGGEFEFSRRTVRYGGAVSSTSYGRWVDFAGSFAADLAAGVVVLGLGYFSVEKRLHLTEQRDRRANEEDKRGVSLHNVLTGPLRARRTAPGRTRRHPTTAR